MSRLRRRAFLLSFFATGLAIAAGCGGGAPAAAVRVGSKDFAEQFVLGELYAQTLEAAGVPVARELNLGGTPVAHAALERGEIDLYPEYTGTGLLTVLKEPVQRDPQQVYDRVAATYRDRFGLVWLDPAPANNSQALVTVPAIAEREGLRTLSDLAAKASTLRAIGPPEFQVREDGLPGLKAAYGGFEFAEYKAVDPGLRYSGLANGEADVAVGFSTDGEIDALGLVVLEDDRGLFPPYQVAPVVRQETLEAYPAIAEALNALAPRLTNEALRRMNYQVTGEGREPADVAREFLAQSGALRPGKMAARPGDRVRLWIVPPAAASPQENRENLPQANRSQPRPTDRDRNASPLVPREMSPPAIAP